MTSPHPPQAFATAPFQANALFLPDDPPQTVRQRPLLQELTERERAAVLERGQRRVLYRGAALFTQHTPNDGIWIIESGRIRVFYAAPSGREITLAYWYPGNFVGGPDVFGTDLHTWSGMAASNASILHLPGRALRQLVLQIPALALSVIEGLTFKGRCYSTLAQMLGTRSITERLAHLLLHLVDLYGVPEADGTLIAAPFTHAELAHMVGATRQWVTTSLKRLDEQKVVTSCRAQIVVLRPDVLARMRGGERCL